jgi:hypothetical protein
MLSIRGGLAGGVLGGASWLVLGACGGTVVTGERERDPNSGSGGAVTGTILPGKAGAGAIGPIGKPVPVGSGGTVSSPPRTGLTGGVAGSGAQPSSGGTLGTGGGSTPTLPACEGAPPRDPGGTGTTHQACCATSLGATGSCVALLAIPDGTMMKQALGHDTCDRTLVCMPDPATFERCGPGAGATGRCVPKCLVFGLTMPMQRDTCASAEDVCAPCFDPVDGTPTDVCTLGPVGLPPAPPVPYRSCGSFDAGAPGGVCVPKSVVDASSMPLGPSLLQDDCPLATDRCVPTAKAKDPAACLPRCTTTLAGLGKQYAAGACVPAFVVRDANASGLAILKRDTCADPNALCAPCADPLSQPLAGVPTHYCE